MGRAARPTRVRRRSTRRRTPAPSPLLAVVDIGTGTVRAQLLDPDGAVCGTASRTQQVRLGEGRAEVDTDEVWGAVCRCMREALARVDGKRVIGVGLASALGYVLLDRAGGPLGPAMLWMDRRAVAEAARLSAVLGPEPLYRTTGRRLDPEVLLAKLAWLRAHEPERFSRIGTFVGLKDDVIRRLTGTIGTDVAHATYTMLYDVAARRWAPDLVEVAGLAESALPAVRRPDAIAGTLTSAAAEATGLPAGIPVVTGTSDGTAACLLAGIESGLAVNVTGTSDVVMTHVPKPLSDPTHRTLVNPYPLGDGFMVGGVMGTTGGALKWLVERLCPDLTGTDRYRRLDEEAARVPPGARGVVALAGLAGERAPRWNAAARGAFVGLDLTHGRAEMARALLESVALSVGALVGALRGLGADIGRLRVVGGGAQSDLWSQIRADVTGLPIEIPRSVEGTVTSAALLAGLGVGLYPDLAEGARRVAPEARTFAPRAEATKEYAVLAALADRVYAALELTWDDLARLRESPS
jgi:sugar (pentulose or hexulose) kinase